MSAVLAGLAAAAAAGLSARFNWWRPKKPGVPILMYHQVGPHRAGSLLNTWRVRVPDLERQLDHLAAKGYRCVALKDLLDDPAGGGPRRVVLTFDDGYRGVLENAMPLLLSRGFSATVFAVSDRTGGVNDWDAERPGEPLLSESELRDLHARGIEIGSHGANHRALTGLGDAELESETAGSKTRLELILAAPVASFCYPYGDFDDRAASAVARAGYRAATVIRSGISPDLSDPFRLRRIPVRGTATFLDFRLALTRGRSRL